MSAKWKTLNGAAPRIIAHRGASGYRPEHTLDGYALAIAQGADVIEPDLVLSRDGVLYARHDLGLKRSTDIATRAEFASRLREIDGERDWWVADFAAVELDTLRAVQPFAERGALFDGRFALPRFSEVLDLASAALAHGRPVGVYPELKDPGYFRSLGMDPVAAVHAALAPRGLARADSPIWLQCFDHAVLRQAHAACGNACYALVETLADDLAAHAPQWHELATWARGIAPGKYLLWDEHGRDHGVVAQAHDLGLEVHAWTFREDRSPLPFATPRAELEAAFALGVDALFCDFPDLAIAARDAFSTM